MFKTLNDLDYENKNKPSELLNPINFSLWLVVSFKDIFKLFKNFSNIRKYKN